MELSERKLKILAAIVNAYIQTGEPVGSKLLALDLGVSSATVRNEMADLVEMGFLEQPHTSAGRVPSQEGYRVFVDRLMGKSPLTAAEKRYFDSILLARVYDPQTLMNDVSRLLADWTRMAAVATTPSGGGADVRAVQFVQTSRRTAMIILISSAGTMKNRVFRCDFDITPQMMQVFFRVVNERVARKPVSSITPAFIQSLAASLGEIAMLMSSALMALLEVAQDSMEAKVFLNGQMNLLRYPEFENGGARRVMDFLERPHDFSRLMVQCGNSQCSRIILGRESKQPELTESGLVFSNYLVNGSTAGMIGVIGPMRMDYSKLVAGVDYLAAAAGKLLTELMTEE